MPINSVLDTVSKSTIRNMAMMRISDVMGDKLKLLPRRK
jgi:hypothetical protein